MDTEKAASSFNIFITGQIESIKFPLGPEASEIFCRYEALAGKDWEFVSGIQSGITQSSSNRNSRFCDTITFNMPIELTYRSTNPFGWPQLLICVYGKVRWGIETCLGYARIHIPLPISGTEKESKTLIGHIIKPRGNSTISDITSWLTGRKVELKNPKILLDSNKTNGLSTESYGEIKVKLHVVTGGSSHFCLQY